MPLENANTISQLDSRWPLGTDSATRGDDHLRLIKAVLKAQFPGRSGQGFEKPLTVDVDFLNDIPGKLFPVGSVVLRMDNVNPGDLYGGTWNLIEGDAFLTFGNGLGQGGNIIGSNDRSLNVPLPKHSHDATFVGEEMTPHKHLLPYKPTGSGGGGTGPDVRGSSGLETEEASAGTPEGKVTIKEAGVDSAKLTFDVKPARIAINVWEKVGQ